MLIKQVGKLQIRLAQMRRFRDGAVQPERGTCLNFYDLKEKLAVGEVTNMYVIVEKMSGADRVVRP